MLTLVLDSNIFVSSFLTPGGEGAEVVRQARAHTIYVSPFILSEVGRTLQSNHIRKKYQYTDSAIERHIKNIYLFSEIVDPQITVSACIDDDDNAVLACAVEAHADYIVTRNVKHFPSEYLGVTIIPPGKFLQIIRER